MISLESYVRLDARRTHAAPLRLTVVSAIREEATRMTSRIHVFE